MRDIEFRGKRKLDGEWVYGDGYCTSTSEDKIKHFDIWAGSMWLEVDPESIGLYTGLKDKNSVKIFEGDIVKDKFGDIGVIIFSEEFCGWKIEYCDIGGSWKMPRNNIEVIGNIHDNPELLHTN